jgi:sugar lactone lactonase YvrE/enterochelin esterase-like enzyme
MRLNPLCKLSTCCIILAFIFPGLVRAQGDPYALGPDSQPQDVPHGTVTRGQIVSQRAYPGVIHNYWLYVPAQYNGQTPAAVMVFQDGGGFVDPKGQFRVPVVFDNLIAKKQMPVTLAIMIDPGILPPVDPKTQLPRIERSFEYDSPTDLYARFLIEEVLPMVGQKYKLTDDPSLRGICGNSSGGVCAFAAAWERPDYFRRVLSNIGSFTDLRDGNRYPDLVRKAEPKPIRVFLQSGTNDLNVFGGSWWVANQDMADAFRWAGYDYQFVHGTEGHNGRHGGAVFPDALRWLWRDYDKPIVATNATPSNSVRDILIPGQEWQPVGTPGGYKLTAGATADERGNVYFSDVAANQIFRVDVDGKLETFATNTDGCDGIRVGPDQRLYACQSRRNRIVAFDLQDATHMEVIADGIDHPNDLAIDHARRIYVTESGKKQLWYIAPDGQKRIVDKGIEFPNGIGFVPDQGQLVVDDMRGVNAYLFDVEPDGALTHKQPFFTAEVPAMAADSGADGLTVDSAGRIYVTTRLGIQVFDQHGRAMAIINKPIGSSLTSVTLGDKDFETMYITCGKSVYQRKTKAQGVHGFQPPVKATMDKLG